MLRYVSGINQFVIDDLDGLFPDGVHAPHPFHLAVGFEPFCDAFLTCELFYELRKHLFGLAVDVCKVVI